VTVGPSKVAAGEAPATVAPGTGATPAPLVFRVGEGGTPGRPSVLPAWLLVVAALCLTGWALARPVPSGRAGADGVRAALVVVWALAALVLAHRGPPTLGRLVAAAVLLGSASLAAVTLAATTSGTDHRAGRALACVLPALLMAAAVHVLAALPDGRLGSTGRRTGVAFAYVVALALGLAAWRGPGRLSPAAALAGWSVAVVVGLLAAAARYRQVSGRDRQRLQWLAAGVTAAVEVGLVVGALGVLVKWPDHPALVAAAATAFVPIGLAAGVVPTLAGKADRVLVVLVQVTGLSLLVTAVYFVIVLGLGHAPDPADREVLGLSMLAAAVVTLGYLAVHRRLEDSVNRAVYGESTAPEDVVKTFSGRLTRAVTMDELLLQLTETLRKNLQLSSAEVLTGTSEVLERAASVPDRGPGTLMVGPQERPVVARAGVSGRAWVQVWLPALLDGRGDVQIRVAPITYTGELLGVIVVERPADGVGFDDEDEGVLTELARQVGLALHNLQLDSALQSTLDELRRQADELRRSRARIIESADAERRKVERDLHDGAQQHLVALAVNLRLARDLVADDPAAATEMLDELAADVKTTVQELRDLAHGIYPPLLMDSGLAEALRAVAARSPLSVTVAAEGLGRYPPQVEAAVYFCCLEALQNAAKHAPASHVRVAAWEEEGGLLFSVTDDGPGFDPAKARGGHGFVNMSDRLGAIGGTVRWESEPGEGAVISGSTPLT